MSSSRVLSALAALLCVLAVLTGGAAEQTRAAPAARPQGTILFAGDRGGNFELYTVRADGSRLGQLTRTPANDTSPAFSPDGRRILFQRSFDLWVMKADGTGQRKLASSASDPVWAPDSQRVAVEDSAGLAILGVNGRRRLVLPGRSYSPSWSPDGKRLAFLIYRGDRRDLAVIGADGHRSRTIRRGVGGSAQWLSNGLIAEDGQLLRPDGRVVERLRLPRDVGSLAWAPDGRRFAFTDEGSLRLYVGSTDGGRTRDVTPKGGGTLEQLAWSHDERWLAVRRRHPDRGPPHGARGELVVVAADGSSSRRVTIPDSYPFGGDNQWPSWRPAGASPKRLGSPPVKPWPSEVATGSRLESSGAVVGLAADGGRVAVAVFQSPSDCPHVSVWAPGTRPVHVGVQESCGQFGAGVVGSLALAGTRVAWVDVVQGGVTSADLYLLASATTRPARVVQLDHVWNSGSEFCCGGRFLGDLQGDGALLAFGSWTQCAADDPENGVPPPCVPDGEPWGRTTVKDERLWRLEGSRRIAVRSGAGSFEATSADAGRISVLEPGGSIDVVGADGSLVHRLVLPRGQALATRLSGSQLVVLTATALEAFDASTDAPVGRVSLGPSESRTLADFDRGVAVLVEGRQVRVVRLADGRATAFSPRGDGPVFAQLEPAGLFLGYSLRGGYNPQAGRRYGRVRFVTRAALERRLA